MNKNPQVFDVSMVINDSFKLFRGKRTRKEDEKIFGKVLGRCLERLLMLAGTKLKPERQLFFEREILKIEKTPEQENQINILKNVFSRISVEADLEPKQIRREMQETIDSVLQKAISNRLKK